MFRPAAVIATFAGIAFAGRLPPFSGHADVVRSQVSAAPMSTAHPKRPSSGSRVAVDPRHIVAGGRGPPGNL